MGAATHPGARLWRSPPLQLKKVTSFTKTLHNSESNASKPIPKSLPWCSNCLIVCDIRPFCTTLFVTAVMWSVHYVSWNSHEGCQFGSFEARFWNSGFLKAIYFLWKAKSQTNDGFFAVGKAWLWQNIVWAAYSLQISSDESIWPRRAQRILQRFYCFPKMFNIYNKKKRYDSVTGNENAHRDWNCIILLQASVPETTHLCTENKLAEMTSNPRRQNKDKRLQPIQTDY